MDTALIIVIAVVVLLVVFLIARRAWGTEARREKAGELRVESTREQERARRAEIEAERKRESAEAAARRADRLDPDTGTSGRRGRFRRDDEGVADDDDVEAEDRDTGERRGLWDRIAGR